MKNTTYIITLLAILFLVQTGNSQVGVKAGFLTGKAHTTKKSLSNSNFVNGYQVGVFYNHCLDCGFSLQAELLYSNRGSEYEVGDFGFKNDIQTLSLPINVKYIFYKPFYTILGPTMMYEIGRTTEFSKLGVKTDIPDDSFKTFDIGFDWGLGAQYRNMFVEARAYYGFLGVDRAIKEPEVAAQKYKNLQFDFSVGYQF